MPSMPDTIVPLLSPSRRCSMPAPGARCRSCWRGLFWRTVASALYALGLQEGADWARYHHVLSRASWSSLDVSWGAGTTGPTPGANRAAAQAINETLE